MATVAAPSRRRRTKLRYATEQRGVLATLLISPAVVIVCAGLLAHALVRKFRGRWLLRFFVLLPWAAPIALTAIGFLWFYDPQASIFTWFLVHLHIVPKSHVPNWLGTPH